MHPTENIELLLRNLGDDWANMSPEELAQRVEELHGIHIEFIEMPLPKNYFGACIIVAQEEEIPTGYVFYAPGLPPMHQSHIKMHELSHLALQHQTVVASYQELEQIHSHPERLFDSTLTIACRAMTPRAELSPREIQEQEAELLTRLIYEKRFIARQKEHLKHGSSMADMDEALKRMGVA